MTENKVKFSNEQIEQMKALYAKTERLTKVAKEFNITPKLAKQILVENGVKVRKIGNKITCQKCGATFSNPDDDIIFCFLNNWGYIEICKYSCEFANTCRKLRRVTKTKVKIYGEMQY